MAHFGFVDRMQARNAGAADFLAKPMRLKIVQAILQHHMGQ